MTWFKVDDTFHSHNKIRKVLADDPAALALWVVAGSWSSANLTDGLVPDHQLPWLYPTDPESLARKLVAARLWRRVRGGYQFHDWEQCNPTAEQVQAIRRARAEAGRKGGTTSGKARSKRQANASANAQAGGKQNRTPSRPVPPPSKEGEEEGAALDWRTLPAFGVERDPGTAVRVQQGAAAARASIRKPAATTTRPHAFDELVAATPPSPDETDEEQNVIPLRSA